MNSEDHAVESPRCEKLTVTITNEVRSERYESALLFDFRFVARADIAKENPAKTKCGNLSGILKQAR